ncbi:hypothetical protein [Azospirillum sp.]|uniref:hypothetical protein n=1 Tax=Azospirillum sp. TaxID=34012 RepID=UPI003D758824
MSVRLLSASAVVVVSLLSSLPPAQAAAAEPGVAPSWTRYFFPVVVGGALGAVAMPYAYPVVAAPLGGALTATGGALYATAPTVGAAALEGAAAAGTYAAGATSAASSYVLTQTVQTQMAIGAGLGALVGYLWAY